MSYDVEELVERIRESGVVPIKGPDPSPDLLKFTKAFADIRGAALRKGIDKLVFSAAVSAVAEKIGVKKSRNRIYQIGRTALKYVKGVEVKKENGRLWIYFVEEEE